MLNFLICSVALHRFIVKVNPREKRQFNSFLLKPVFETATIPILPFLVLNSGLQRFVSSRCTVFMIKSIHLIFILRHCWYINSDQTLTLPPTSLPSMEQLSTSWMTQQKFYKEENVKVSPPSYKAIN